MRQSTRILGICTTAALVGLGPAETVVAAPAAKGGVDTAAVAERVVSQTAGVKEGDVVHLVGNPADVELLEDLAVAVRKRGAFPLVTISSDRMNKKMVEAVPAKYDAQSPKLGLALAGIITTRIVIPPNRDPATFAALPPERRLAIGKAEQPVTDAVRKKGIKFVELSNGLFPSPIRAKELGVSERELAKIFWDGVSADYAAVQEKGKALKAMLAAGSELHISHPNGTDLKLKVTKRPVLVSDGVISDDDVKAGGAAVQVWLPAGEVYLVPVAGSAEGKIVDDRELFDGKEIKNITAEVKAGKITAISAKSGWEVVKPHYDIAGPRKDEVSVVDFGINPAIKSSGKLKAWSAAGTVTIGVGENTWAGGDIPGPGGFYFQLIGCTVTLDGKPMVEKGVLK